MSEIRKHGIAYLTKFVENPDIVAVSKKYTAEESWTGRAAWWFDVPVEKIENNPEHIYYLLCEKENNEFHILKVPNKFFIDNMNELEDRYNDKIRLHLEAEKTNCFVDQRGNGKVDFSSYLTDFDKYPILSFITERDMDLLFIEEFICSGDFANWFLISVSEEIPSLGDINIDSRDVFHSVMKVGKGSGESDIVLNLKCNNKIIRILIENKIDAQFQQDQPERYQLRTQDEVENGDCDESYCILMAPNEYLESTDGSDSFDSTVSYESIIEFFESRIKNVSKELSNRLLHKKELLEQSIFKYRRGYSPDIDNDVTVFWQKYYQLASEKYPKLKLKKPGSKPCGSRFVIFGQALNSPHPLPRCTIKHKLEHGKIDVEFSGWAKEQEKVEKKISTLLQNNMQINKAGKSLAVSIALPKVKVKTEFDKQKSDILSGLNSAQYLMDWYNKNLDALQDIARELTD